MVRLLGALLKDSRVQDLHACRRLCGIPSSVVRKDDLINELMRRAQSPPQHKAILANVLDCMTTTSIRRWVSSMRLLGFVVPPAKVMGRNRAEIVNAIICNDLPATSDDRGVGATCTAELGTHVGESNNQQADLGMALVAFDGPGHTRRRLHKRWSKLARRAALPGL